MHVGTAGDQLPADSCSDAQSIRLGVRPPDSLLSPCVWEHIVSILCASFKSSEKEKVGK